MSVTVTIGNAGTPDQALSISVVGSDITVTPATDGSGNITSTSLAIAALVNSTPAAAALVTAASSTMFPIAQPFGGSCSPAPACFIGDPEVAGVQFTIVLTPLLTLTFKGMKVYPTA
jgi:hypothetical protein